jgi:hypothetical protein
MVICLCEVKRTRETETLPGVDLFSEDESYESANGAEQ